ncbi:MAG TPA: helix-turn-helix transcriptional regulator [Galbitalea sp.]|jgi:XRE family transcriptional regulator of biofilm formation
MPEEVRPEGHQAETTLGQRISGFRRDRALSTSALAARAGLSKSYLSILEADAAETRRPSVRTLQRIATALGVLLSDLTGGAPARGLERTPELVSFASSEGLPDSDIDMLASIQFRGQAPQSEERWRYIYNAIRISEPLDEGRGRGGPLNAAGSSATGEPPVEKDLG